MKGAENKYLKTISRVFGPAVEKAMPVMLKVAFGSIGVLFVTALVLIYSDKRFGDALSLKRVDNITNVIKGRQKTAYGYVWREKFQ